MIKQITVLVLGLFVVPSFSEEPVDSVLKNLMRAAIADSEFRKEMKLTRYQTEKYEKLSKIGREEIGRKFEILSNPDGEDYLRRREIHKKFLKESGIEDTFKELFKEELKGIDSKSGEVPGLMETFRYQSPEYKAAVKTSQEERRSLNKDLWNTFNKTQKARLLRMARYLKMRKDGIVKTLRENNGSLGNNKLTSSQLKTILRKDKSTQEEWKQSFELEILKLKEEIFRETLRSEKVGFSRSMVQEIREAASEDDPDVVLSFAKEYKRPWNSGMARLYQRLRAVDSDLRREILAKALFEKRMAHLWSLLEAKRVQLTQKQKKALVDFYDSENSTDYWCEWLAIDIERLNKLVKYDGRARNVLDEELKEPLKPKEF